MSMRQIYGWNSKAALRYKYIDALSMESEKQKRNSLRKMLHCIGPEAIDIYNTCELISSEINKYEVLISKSVMSDG